MPRSQFLKAVRWVETQACTLRGLGATVVFSTAKPLIHKRLMAAPTHTRILDTKR